MSNLEGVGVTPPSNQSNNHSCGQVDTSAHLFFMVAHSLVFLVGLILNGFTLRVYFCRAQRASSSVTIYLKNLAAADFLLSLCLPIRIANYASSSVAVHLAYCNFGASAFYLNMYASILFMGYIAANRYLKIVHPLGTHILQTVRVAHIVCVVTWGFLLTTTSTYVLLSLFTQKASESKTVSCNDLHSEPLRLFYKIVHTCSAAIFLLVLVSLVFFYHSTSRKLSLAQQRQPLSSGSKKLAKSRRNMLVLVSVFVVCFVPYHLIRVPYAFVKDDCSWRQAFFYLKELTLIVSVLNVCLDPLIYFIFCKAFRAQMSLRRVFSPAQEETQDANTERRSSSLWLSSIKINRKASLTSATKQTSMLELKADRHRHP